jgi:Family of unknown function (DUF5343)
MSWLSRVATVGPGDRGMKTGLIFVSIFETCSVRPPTGCYVHGVALPTSYLTTFKNGGEILQAIQGAQAPARFTQKFLEGVGYGSSNDRAMY